MAAYHLWHPAYVTAAPVTVEAFVTLGDAMFLGHGTDAFVRAVLNAIEPSLAPAGWQMDAMRTHYFGSYRGASADWRDAWDLAWRLRVVIAAEHPPELPAPPPWGYRDVEAPDASFRPDQAAADSAGWPCLLLVDAAELSVLEACRAIVEAGQPQALCVLTRVNDQSHQLRCDLGFFGRSFYEQGADVAEGLLRACAAAGGTVQIRTVG